MSAQHTAESDAAWLAEPRGHMAQGVAARPSLSSVERDAEAAHLRTAGWSYRQIAHRLGIAEHTARRCVQRALDRVPVESVTELRMIENSQIDADMARLDEIITDPPMIVAASGQVTSERDMRQVTLAIEAKTRLRARRARLNGLDMPQVSVHATMTASEMEARLMAGYAAIREAARQEALQAARLELEQAEGPPAD